MGGVDGKAVFVPNFDSSLASNFLMALKSNPTCPPSGVEGPGVCGVSLARLDEMSSGVDSVLLWAGVSLVGVLLVGESEIWGHPTGEGDAFGNSSGGGFCFFPNQVCLFDWLTFSFWVPLLLLPVNVQLNQLCL
jgi:hypothetical protein